MTDGGWTGVDRWVASGDHSVISEQTVRITKKEKCSAFGEAVVGSGRAEWDLNIDFESYGGIAIGVYRQDLRDRDNINALPTEETFTYTPDGYGYANKTGAFTANRERKKYGIRYRNGDKVTVRLDLQSRTLTFLVNDASQGLAYEGLPKGAYRLACCLQFQEQKVIIQRFWTSLGKDATIPKLQSTQTTTEVKDKIGKEHASVESPDYAPPVAAPVKNGAASAAAQTAYEEYKAPEIDPDAPMFGNDYGDDGDDVYVPADSDDDDDGANEVSTKEESLDEDEKVRLQELEQGRPKHRKTTSIEDVHNDISEQYGQELNTQLDELDNLTEEDYSKEEKEDAIAALGNTDAVGLIAGRSRGVSQADAMKPEPLSIETKEEDATDYFSLSGGNLKTDRSSVTCTRQSNGSAHSAFGTQLVSRGRIEWMIKIDAGHSIRIGVCGNTDSTDRDFTQTKYGYGYGDDGNIYFGGSHIEYNDGFKAGDIVGVYLNMDMNTLKFSVNGTDHGAAFDSIHLDDKDNVIGYRLAISLQHRPHKLTLLDSTVYNVERRSPRPSSNTFGKNGNGHQRKLSHASMNKLPNASKVSNKSSDAGGGAGKKKKSDKKDGAAAKSSKSSASAKTSKSSASAASKKKSGKDANASKKKNTTAASKKTSSGASKKKKAEAATATKKKKTDALTTPAKKAASASKKKSVKKTAADDEKKAEPEWRERENVAKDSWVACGPKLVTDKLTVSTKTNIKDGNTAFGKLGVKNKMKVAWELAVKQGDNIGIGVCNVNGALSSAKNKKLLAGSFTNDIAGYGYMGKDGGKQRQGRYKKYGQNFKSGDKVSVLLDMSAKTLSFAVNGADQGDAFKNLPSGEYKLALVFFEKASKVSISKTTVYDL